MRVTYRRMSGAVGLTDMERGSRGMWLEKRRALLAELARRGHGVSIVNRMTKFSMPPEIPPWDPKRCDLLMIEFGSSNAKFYGEDLDGTSRMIDSHEGNIVFLCDDPDLPYTWKTVTKKIGRWVVWMNATRGEAFGGQPAGMVVRDAPFAALLPKPLTPIPLDRMEPAVYIGRPKGREKALRGIFEAGVELEVCGRAKEWEGFDVRVIDAPDQGARGAFYRRRLASVVVADRKHKRMGWRTGRAYHALYAGTPAVVEADHEALAETFTVFHEPGDLRDTLTAWKTDPRLRAKAWDAQMNAQVRDRVTMDETLRASGL